MQNGCTCEVRVIRELESVQAIYLYASKLGVSLGIHDTVELHNKLLLLIFGFELRAFSATRQTSRLCAGKIPTSNGWGI